MKPTLSEVLNDTAEWHALGIGAFIGLLFAMGRPELAGVVIAGVLGGQYRRKTHLSDAKREFAYLVVGTIAVLAGSTLL
jgi:hypothetical protein